MNKTNYFTYPNFGLNFPIRPYLPVKSRSFNTLHSRFFDIYMTGLEATNYLLLQEKINQNICGVLPMNMEQLSSI